MKLVFNADAVRGLVEHSLANRKNQNPVAFTKAVVKKPALMLVHDQGVYLLSNGKLGGGETPSKLGLVAYAKGCDPKADADWYDTAHDLVGGDDFAETLEWADEVKQMLDDGASAIVVNFSRSRLSLSAVYPKGKGPQRQVVPWTPETLLAHVQKLMRKKAVAFDPKTGALSTFKVPYSDRLAKLQPALTFLNAVPLSEVCKIVERHVAALAKKGRAA